MALRSSLDLELRPLLKALRNRIDGLRGIVMEPKDRLEVFSRDGVPFMQLEIRRDHMNVDLWLPEDKLVEARSTDLARPHPFDPDNAVVVRFERATDLTKVARWLEDAHRYAVERKDSCDTTAAGPAAAKAAPRTKVERKKSGPKTVERAQTSRPRSAKTASNGTKTAAAKKTAAAGSAKRTATKRSPAARRA